MYLSWFNKSALGFQTYVCCSFCIKSFVGSNNLGLMLDTQMICMVVMLGTHLYHGLYGSFQKNIRVWILLESYRSSLGPENVLQSFLFFSIHSFLINQKAKRLSFGLPWSFISAVILVYSNRDEHHWWLQWPLYNCFRAYKFEWYFFHGEFSVPICHLSLLWVELRDNSPAHPAKETWIAGRRV